MRHVSDAYVYKYNHARAHNIYDTNAYVSHCVCVCAALRMHKQITRQQTTKTIGNEIFPQTKQPIDVVADAALIALDAVDQIRHDALANMCPIILHDTIFVSAN